MDKKPTESEIEKQLTEISRKIDNMANRLVDVLQGILLTLERITPNKPKQQISEKTNEKTK